MERTTYMQKKRKGGFTLAEFLVVIAIIVVGISMFNNYEKMKKLETAVSVMEQKNDSSGTDLALDTETQTKLVIEDLVLERTGEHVGVVNVPMERVRIPCGGKLAAGDMLRGPVRNRA